jgi:hypothetical protein
MRYLLFVLILLTILPAQAGHSAPKVLFRVHVQTTGTGLSEDQAHTVLLPPNGEAIQVRALPEVSEQNLIGVEPKPGGTLFSFDHQGQVALDAVTAQNQGRILVVLVDGYVVYAPLIDQQISNGQLLVPRPMAPNVIQLLKQVAAQNLREHTRG